MPETIVVKFRDEVSLPYVDRVETHLRQRNIGAWDRIVNLFPGSTLRRLFTALDPQEILELVRRATNRAPAFEAPNFFAYFLLDCPRVRADDLVQEFRSWPVVQNAYLDPPVVNPSVQTFAEDTRPLSQKQEYLNEINAPFAWGQPGGLGRGQQVIDLEAGWTLNHQDLLAHGVPKPINIDDRSRHHGTSVLGVICAGGGPDGYSGIAPDLAAVGVVSHGGKPTQIANAILDAMDKLSFGDVLTLEVAVEGNMPCEAFSLNSLLLKNITMATILGIVVVEAAGNAGAPSGDLDQYADSNGNNSLKRGDTALEISPGVGFQDSGAIMVGAATAAAPHLRLASSNFGTRVDCYAWGENVYAPSSDTTGATDLYDDNFGRTSGATAIIAGVALAVQGMAEAKRGVRFDPKRLRQILSNERNGTPNGTPGNEGSELIGVMPDLKKIFANEL